MKLDDLRDEVSQHFKCYQDFPIPGILFRDMMPLFSNPTLLDRLCQAIAEHYKGKIDVVAALEARGFLFGPLVAIKLGVPFVPIRKKGKLPGPILVAKYQKEYGEDVVEMQQEVLPKSENVRVLLLDDLLATGGTLRAATELLRLCKTVSTIEVFVLAELTYLNGRDVQPKDINVYSFIKFDT
ncbi:phosphoribosyl transferase domain-containing protein [Ditylenchus destructor]|nr:phosphoribosyl transferase domain-containing protein [Ditylenchus destructor]